MSAQNLNRVTKQVDIDLYDEKGDKVPIHNMAVDIQIIIPRMIDKDRKSVSFDPEIHLAKVNVASRIAELKKRNKLPLIYHYLNITRYV